MVLKYYADMEYTPISGMLIQVGIKTDNQLMAFSDSSWEYCPDTGRSIGVYIIFHQGGPIDHVKHVPGPVAQSSAESYYNSACTAVLTWSHFMMLIH